MSTTTTWEIYKTKTKPLGEHRNGWFFGRLIWQYLEDKYLPKTEFSRLTSMNGEEELVWSIPDRDDVKAYEKTAMLATYDRSYCGVANLSQCADHLDIFHEEFMTANPESHTHCKAIASEYRQTLKDRDHRLLGIYANPTSVVDLHREPDFLSRTWDFSLHNDYLKG